MRAQDLIKRYSIARRSLAGQCEGVTIHLCYVPGGKHFGGVVDGDTAWVVKLRPDQVEGFVRETAGALYAEMAAERRAA